MTVRRAAASSRRRTRDTGVFVRDTPAVRALERGLEVLRAFRPGIVTLTNVEIADRTGLPRATVSRLTGTLVERGFLEFDFEASAYRLGAPFLSFGLSVREGSPVLRVALPLMRDVADGLRINVGLAVVDEGEVVYLDSVRKSRLGLFRHVVSGSRLPIAETALGRAWLGGLDPGARRGALASLEPRYGERWPALSRQVARSLAQVQREGWCGVAWTTGLVSIATPIVAPGLPVHAFIISFPSPDAGGAADLERRHAPLLLETAARIREALQRRAR